MCPARDSADVLQDPMNGRQLSNYAKTPYFIGFPRLNIIPIAELNITLKEACREVNVDPMRRESIAAFFIFSLLLRLLFG